MISCDVRLPHQVHITALELSVEDGEIGNVFEDQLLDVWAFSEIFGVSHEFEMIPCNPLTPFECAGADRRLVEGGVVWIGLLLEDVLGHDEGFGQERKIRRKNLFHSPRDLRGRDHRDVAHEGMASCAPTPEGGIGDQFEGEFHILGREGFAVVPAHTVTQTDAPFEAVLRNAAVLLVRYFDGKVGLNLTLWVDPEERVENREMHTIIDFNVRHQRIEDGRLLSKSDDDATARFGGGLLSEGRRTQQAWGSEAGSPGHHQSKCTAP